MPPERRTIAFVVQRYGLAVNGGAELHCRWVAEHLAAYFDVHILTTCAEDYYTWKNVYRPGIEVLEGVQVHRFPVDYPRNWSQFQRLNEKVLCSPHSYLDELEWMRRQGPFSSALLAHINDRRDDYAAFIFFTYLYAHTYFGLQLVPEKALLVPTAHDDPQLRIALFRGLFRLPRHIIYNTEAERRLVQNVFHNETVPSSVVGTGINLPSGMDADRFRRKYGLTGDFLLYTGRIDVSKNVPELVDYFLRFRSGWPSPLKLVLIGRANLPIPAHPDVVALGFLPEEEKFDALVAATAAVVPSRVESLSMALLETWLVERPALVNGACEVLRDQAVMGRAALWYESYDQFALALQMLLTQPRLAARLGQNGSKYARQRYPWALIERQYNEILAGVV